VITIDQHQVEGSFGFHELLEIRGLAIQHFEPDAGIGFLVFSQAGTGSNINAKGLFDRVEPVQVFDRNGEGPAVANSDFEI
jgi:hypothetical protein